MNKPVQINQYAAQSAYPVQSPQTTQSIWPYGAYPTYPSSPLTPDTTEEIDVPTGSAINPGSFSSLLGNIGGIRQWIDRMGGIDGVLANVSKMQKLMGTIQQMAPMMKMLMSGWGAAKANAINKNNNLAEELTRMPRRRRRRKHRRIKHQSCRHHCSHRRRNRLNP